MAPTINIEDMPERPATLTSDSSTPLGTFLALLPKQQVLVIAAEEPLASACQQLHDRGLRGCVVRFPSGSLHLFRLVDLCGRLLDAFRTDGVVSRVVKVWGACAIGELAQKEPVSLVAPSVPLSAVLDCLTATNHGRVGVAGADGAVERLFTCSDLLELLLRYAHSSFAPFRVAASRVLDMDVDVQGDQATPEMPVMQCLQTLHQRGLAGMAVVDDSDPRQSFRERALGMLDLVDVQHFILRSAEEASDLASKSAGEFVALGMRGLPATRAGAGAAHYPFIHADADQNLEALVSKLLSSKAHCIAMCSPQRNTFLGMVRAHDVIRCIRNELPNVMFEHGSGKTPGSLPSPRFWPSPTAASASSALGDEVVKQAESRSGAACRRVSWKDTGSSASLASIIEFEPEHSPKNQGGKMVLCLEDAHAGSETEVVKLPRPQWQLPLPPPPASPSAASSSGASGTEQLPPHHHHILSVLALEDPTLQASLEPRTNGIWRQLSPGADSEAAPCGPTNHRHTDGTEQLQLVLYQRRELVLYDRSRNRAFARRLTEEQAQMITTNQQSFCPLCRQRLNPTWAFVVEGYFEMLSAMAPVPPSAPPHTPPGSGFSSNEEAAAACGLHSIPVGLLNQGYYHRFFVEDRKLGSGSFGAVYLCRHFMDEIELGVFAVKKLALGDDTKRLRQVMREVKALERLRHMNIIDYKHSWLEVSRHSEFCPYVPFLFILMEYCNAGSLENLIWPDGFVRGAADNAAKSTALAEELIWLLFLDVCRGLRHLHGRSILHRDLKPSNILLHVDDIPSDSGCAAPGTVPRAILSDFGTCEIMGEGLVGGGHVQGGYAIEFSAPERLAGEESDEPADMWSAGLVLYAMAFGDLPFHSEDPQACRERVMAHTVLPELPGWRDSTMRGLISALTAREPVARPTAEEAERVTFGALSRRQQNPTGKSSANSPKLLPPAGIAPLTLLDKEASPRAEEQAHPMEEQAQSFFTPITHFTSTASIISDLGEESFMSNGGRASP